MFWRFSSYSFDVDIDIDLRLSPHNFVSLSAHSQIFHHLVSIINSCLNMAEYYSLHPKSETDLADTRPYDSSNQT